MKAAVADDVVSIGQTGVLTGGVVMFARWKGRRYSNGRSM